MISKLSLRTKLIAIFVFSFISFMVIVIFTIVPNLYQLRVQSELGRLKNEIQQSLVAFEKDVNDLKEDLLIISSNPDLRNIINNDSEESDTESIIKLQELLVSLGEVKGVFTQIRYINKDGIEELRIDYTEEGTFVKRIEELQDKSNRYYFSETIQLDQGEIYSSKIDLNRDGLNNEISKPLQPTLRLATPIYSEINQLEGILVFNIDAFSLLENFAITDQTYYIADQEGFFVYHPEEDKRFSGSDDLDTGHNIKDICGNCEGLLFSDTDLIFQNGTYYIKDTIDFGNSSNLNLIYEANRSDLIEPINDNVQITFSVTIITGLILLIIIVLVINKWLSTITKLTKKAKDIEDGDFSTYTKLSKSSGEITVLANAIDSMSNRLKKIYKDLDDTVERQKMDNNLLTQAIESSTNFIYITDLEGNIIYANSASLEVTGYSKDEVIGKKAGSLWGGKMSREFYEDMWQNIHEDKQTFVSNIRGIKKDGTEFISRLKISPLVDEDNNLLNYVAFQDDVTEQAKLDEVKSEFITVISHQLRTPLSSINWSIELLRNDKNFKITNIQRELLRGIDESSHRLSRLASNLIEMVEFEESSIKIEIEKVDIFSLINEVTDNYSKNNSYNNPPEFIINIQNDLKHVDSNHIYLKKVLDELISNSIIYSEEPKIEINVQRINGFIEFRIVDNGIGISAQDKSKIFKKFYRSEEAYKVDPDRSGLGLYLCKLIVTRLGGEIGFKSTENEGSIFWFRLKSSL